MRNPRTWIVVTSMLLLLGVVLAGTAPGCGSGPSTLHQCPDTTNGIFDPDCCTLFGVGCAAPCVLPAPQLQYCLAYFCPQCNPQTYPSDEPDTCADWYQQWCTPDGGGADAGPGASCGGECVPTPPSEWFGPSLVGFGPDGTEIGCPSSAPVVSYQGHADFIPPPAASCSACSCSPSAGTCSPPSSITLSDLPCNMSLMPARDFNGPPQWQGQCTAYDALTATDSCNGNPCASLTAGPMVLTETGCMPSTTALTGAVPPSWSTQVLECVGTTSPAITCNNPGLTCAPSAAQAPGFRTCIFQEGDDDCPAGYVEKHLTYASFTDDRGCTPCSCGTPDSSCSGVLTAYEGGGCSPQPPSLMVTLGDGGSCEDITPPGSALGSKQMTIAYYPGSCPPQGGAVTGGTSPSGAATFCCLADPADAGGGV